ncbi:MAG: HAMP domain-containing protein [Desulfomonile tiedjei]|uniref:histidine kinase n=1 Tax=Desulfomonile tiedjei TaxID=2358 RepID=A0A9D6V2X6_9BACT|nr:HAMP domain-containing protein [Desulfomonile tiedjei]
MTIRQKLIIGSAALLTSTICIGAVLVIDSRGMETGIERMTVNSELVRIAFRLRILTEEYLDSGHERPFVQWKNQYDLLKQTLARAELIQPEEQEIIQSLAEDSKKIGLLFSKLASPSLDSPAVKDKLQGMLTRRLSSLVDDSSQLNRATQQTLAGEQRVLHIMTGSGVGLLVLMVFSYIYFMTTSVLRPLARVLRGVQLLSAGDFNHRIHFEHSDEFGTLADTFNRMTERLRESYDSLKNEIAERARAEQDLIRSNVDLEQFAYVASHDLQEPLRNVAGSLQLLEKKYKDKLDADAHRYIQYAVEGAVRMNALIQDLLTFSRVGTRGKPPQPTDCAQILDQALKNLKTRISQAAATITHGPLPTIFSDDTQLLQVFQNLIANAIKFRSDKPPKVHVSAIKDDHGWIFSVEDNGIGIESRHLDRIFEIFQRLHKQTEYDGTGIGLAITKKIVERHRGRIWVESEVGVGTTFHFKIPVIRSLTHDGVSDIVESSGNSAG